MDALWREIHSATWVANVLLPSLIALLAIGLAYLGIRHQIRQDRELMRAERRADATRDFAERIEELLPSWRRWERLDPRWRMTWSQSPVYEAWNRAIKSFPEAEAFNEVARGATDLAYAWQACQARLREVEASQGEVQAAHAASALIYSHLIILREFNRVTAELMRWDGQLPAPRVEWKLRHLPLPEDNEINLKMAAARDLWLGFYRERFDHALAMEMSSD